MSDLLKYINRKTVSANRGSKARGSFANLYAIYVLIEDYINKNYHKSSGYDEYDGARFSDLFKRQREFSFGSKLQNHALNHRMNQEFRKLFPTCEYIPIIRDPQNKRYWINENLVKIKIKKDTYNLAESIVKIIDAYIEAKKDAFENFIKTCEKFNTISKEKPGEIEKFILELIAPNVDARIFEIVSYSILKYYYFDQTVYFGFDLDSIEEENLKLYKTGRTNSNDGGIDFVMKPLGKFFQVTETTDIKKYFLDIDKIEKYPMTFVIKSEETEKKLLEKFTKQAKQQYSIKLVVKKYMSCVEEIINIQKLKQHLNDAIKLGYLNKILDEIIIQSKVEFNYEEEG